MPWASRGRHWHLERLALSLSSCQTNVLVRVLYSTCCFRRLLNSFHHGCAWCSLRPCLSMDQQQYSQSKRPSLEAVPIIVGGKNSCIHCGEIKLKIRASGASLRKKRNCISETPGQFMAMPDLGKELWAVSRGMRKSWRQRQGAGHGHRGLVWPNTRC